MKRAKTILLENGFNRFAIKDIQNRKTLAELHITLKNNTVQVEPILKNAEWVKIK